MPAGALTSSVGAVGRTFWKTHSSLTVSLEVSRGGAKHVVFEGRLSNPHSGLVASPVSGDSAPSSPPSGAGVVALLLSSPPQAAAAAVTTRIPRPTRSNGERD